MSCLKEAYSRLPTLGIELRAFWRRAGRGEGGGGVTHYTIGCPEVNGIINRAKADRESEQFGDSARRCANIAGDAPSCWGRVSHRASHSLLRAAFLDCFNLRSIGAA